MEKEIIFVCCDKVEIKVKEKIALQYFAFYRKENPESDDNVVFHFPENEDFDSNSVKNVIEWCELDKNANETDCKIYLDKILKSDSFDGILKMQILCDYFFDSDVLFNIISKYVNDYLQNKNVDEMRQLFHLKNDLTPDEIKKIDDNGSFLCT
uniref:SKP1 component dimerisation domain-containing protein n=1 Tax=viral metagenome TaxID=1070528 RepID=A0A6C0JT17_9ZZZZ